MDITRSQNFAKAEKILLGLELAYPEDELLSKVRFTLETLTFDPDHRERYLSDFFAMVKTVSHFPVTPFIRSFLEADSALEELRALLNLLNHLSYDVNFKNFHMMLRHLEVIEGSEKNVRGLITQWLTDLEEPGEAPLCAQIKSLYLESDSFVLIKKLCDFYHELYPSHPFLQLKKSYEHHVNLNSPQQFFGWVYDYKQHHIYSKIKGIAYEQGLETIEDAFTKGQMHSKLWALQALKGLNLHDSVKSVLLLCGWVGVFARLMFDRFQTQIITSVDVEPMASRLATTINIKETDEGRFRALTEDIFNLNYFNFRNTDGLMEPHIYPERFDLIVNTSCEHIADFSRWYAMIPEGQLVLLQSNNYFSLDEHVNCVNDIEEFQEMAPMSELLFSGDLPLETYHRFMLIGRK